MKTPKIKIGGKSPKLVKKPLLKSKELKRLAYEK